MALPRLFLGSRIRHRRETLDSLWQRANEERREARQLRLHAEFVANATHERVKRNHLSEAIYDLMHSKGPT